MSQALLDKSSWDRALGPTIRVIGYFASIFAILYIIFLIFRLLVTILGFPEIVIQIFAVIGPFILFFAFIWSFFKVIDEELASKKRK